MSVPETCKAVVIKGPGIATIEDVSTPKARDGYLLVKPRAVAINPTDWKHVDHVASPGARVGCDYVGDVVAIGPKVTKPFKIGDRIAGFVHGSNFSQLEDGAFGTIIAAKAGVQIAVPEEVRDEEAATWGVTIMTVGQGLYQSLGLPLPFEPATPETAGTILIYGGSTATGIGGVQFAKLSGWKVATTCSPRNFEYVKSLGADEVFDYSSPTCAADIKVATSNSLTVVWDCISTPESAALCATAMSDSQPGKYGALLSVDAEIIKKINPNVQCSVTLAYTSLGEHFVKWDRDFPARPEDYEFAQMWMEEARKFLADGRVKLAKPIINQGGKGLEGTIAGMEALKEGKVSAGKLVYTL